jgi:5-methylcytosine-specific restriction endonuclease McrA
MLIGFGFLFGIFLAGAGLTIWASARERKAARRSGEHWLAGNMSAGLAPEEEQQFRARVGGQRDTSAGGTGGRRTAAPGPPPWHRRGRRDRRQYRAYIDSPEWRWKRSLRKQLDEYTCCRCGGRTPAVRQLDVHHLTYARLGHEAMSDLRTLCRDCHSDVHAGAPGRRAVPNALSDDEWIAQTAHGAMALWGERGERATESA